MWSTKNCFFYIQIDGLDINKKTTNIFVRYKLKKEECGHEMLFAKNYVRLIWA